MSSSENGLLHVESESRVQAIHAGRVSSQISCNTWCARDTILSSATTSSLMNQAVSGCGRTQLRTMALGLRASKLCAMNSTRAVYKGSHLLDQITTALRTGLRP